MRKYQWLLVLILIGYISAFTGYERSEEMLKPVLPDAEPTETVEMSPEEMPSIGNR